jgi:cytochrome c oxidase cbb3-type subunit 3
MKRPSPASIPLAALVAAAAVAALSACKREERRFSDPQILSADLYEGNAWAMAQGQRLYAQMNCVGCHANGGGGMGPPLIDGKWRYGGDPDSIFETIVSGRPNGMPGFRARLDDAQVWQLVTFVRAMSGQEPPSAEPGRQDHMSVQPPLSRKDKLPMTKVPPP